VDLGFPAFAYWSPLGHRVALGYASDVPSELDVTIYDAGNDTWQAIGLRISQEDIPLFDSGIEQTNILWSDDSQAIVILNPQTNQLYLAKLSGEQQAIAGGQLIPKLWSSDNRYLLTIGHNAEGIAGAFIVDFQTGTVSPLESRSPIVSWRINVLWSPDSRHLAILENAPNQQGSMLLSVYDNEGHLVREAVTPESLRILIYANSMRWLDTDD
jgi:hypothetical protein